SRKEWISGIWLLSLEKFDLRSVYHFVMARTLRSKCRRLRHCIGHLLTVYYHTIANRPDMHKRRIDTLARTPDTPLIPSGRHNFVALRCDRFHLYRKLVDVLDQRLEELPKALTSVPMSGPWNG